MTTSITAKVVIVGASLGGVLATASACARFLRNNDRRSDHPPVVLIAEHDWLGGQMTAQGVPPDEHKFIEHGGAPASYMAFRQAMRAHYLQNPEFVDNTEMTEGCNPGDGWVSRLCFEPAVAAAYFEALLAPFVDAGVLQICRGASLISACRGEALQAGQIVSICVGINYQSINYAAPLFIDATDTGELILQAGLSYRLGKEAAAEFRESDAPEFSALKDQQPVTLVMALKRCHAPQSAITKPTGYEFWAAYVLPHYHYRLFSNNLPGHGRGQAMQLPFFGSGQTLDLWRYRRIVSARNWRLTDRQQRDEISLINWAQNDYGLQPLLDGGASQAEVLAAARELSLCLLYWLQTAAVREDGGVGYDNLALAPEVLGTKDGFAQQIYVRESRRIIGYKCLTQTDILADGLANGSNDLVPAFCADSIAVGWYNMDIHPTVESGHGVNAKVRPFEIPLGCLVPRDCDNLIAACKNISVTHLVNAATRVHPIEWAIGEAAGVLAAYCIESAAAPGDVAQSPPAIAAVQAALLSIGGQIHWDAQALQSVLGGSQNSVSK
jgi:FAD dependent oxidoreductase